MVDEGDEVFAITRRPEFGQELEQAGVRPIVWDWYAPWTHSQSLIDLVGGQLSTILISVSMLRFRIVQPKDPHRRFRSTPKNVND